jgi:hypothetical protein
MPRQRLASVLRRGLALRYSCPEACSVLLTATLDARAARRLGLSRSGRSYVVGRLQAALTANRTTVVYVRLSRRSARVLAKQRTVTLTLNATATDLAGNRATSKRTVKLRR